MEEHNHAPKEFSLDGHHCSCGVKICEVLSPDEAVRCNLEEGHFGPHRNTRAPGYGTW